MSRQVINRHEDIAEVVNHGGPYVTLQFLEWVLLVNANKNISRIFQVSDIGASVLDFLKKEKFQEVTRLSTLLLAYRGPYVSHIYSEHIKKYLIPSRLFTQAKPSFWAGLFCANDVEKESPHIIKTTGDINHSVLFTQDGKWFVTQSNICGVKLWDVATGQCVKQFKYTGLSDAYVDTDGTVIILARKMSTKNSDEYYVDLFNCHTEKYNRILKVARLKLPDFLKISSDKKYIFYHLNDSDKIRAWNIKEKKLHHEFQIRLPFFHHHLFTSNRNMTHIFLKKSYYCYSIYNCDLLQKIKYSFDLQLDPDSHIVDISPGGKNILITSYNDSVISAYDIETRDCIFQIHNNYFNFNEGNSPFFVDDGKKIVVISNPDSRYNKFNMHLFCAYTGKTIAHSVLCEEPACHAVYKDQFLLSFHREGIRIFSAGRLVSEENMLDISDTQQFTPQQ